MSIGVKLEYWNEAPDPDAVHVITHSRQKFYTDKDYTIHINTTWYEFSMDGMPLHELGHDDIIPDGFIRVPDTDYYEFGGSAEEAINNLTHSNFTLIVKGEEI